MTEVSVLITFLVFIFVMSGQLIGWFFAYRMKTRALKMWVYLSINGPLLGIATGMGIALSVFTRMGGCE